MKKVIVNSLESIDFSSIKECHIFDDNKKISLRNLGNSYYEVSKYLLENNSFIKEEGTEVVAFPFLVETIQDFFEKNYGDFTVFIL